jgi:hypothetical protein
MRWRQYQSLIPRLGQQPFALSVAPSISAHISKQLTKNSAVQTNSSFVGSNKINLIPGWRDRNDWWWMIINIAWRMLIIFAANQTITWDPGSRCSKQDKSLTWRNLALNLSWRYLLQLSPVDLTPLERSKSTQITTRVCIVLSNLPQLT